MKFYWGNKYACPVIGEYEITSGYGERVHPISGKGSFHSGVDFAAVKGTKVVSSKAGEVIRANIHNQYGSLVIIRHKNGEASLYAHLDEIFVDLGEAVESQEIIGSVGNSGRATGFHLHFEIIKKEYAGRINCGEGGIGFYAREKLDGKIIETRVDPMRYLRLS